MMNETFLFDTYALIEIINKNLNYEPYTKAGIIINDFVFSEYCYLLMRKNVKDAQNLIDEVSSAIVCPNAEVIKKAMRFRVDNKKKNLSMTDSISYIMAKELGVKFLTGDKEFETLDGVEFVK